MAITLHTAPARDWLPAGLPITYVFQTDNPEPPVMAVRIEVSRNGIDFTSPLRAGVMQLPPDASGRYAVNVAPYLMAMFEPTAPILTGTDVALYKRYRLVVGEAPAFTGFGGLSDLTTATANALYAMEQTNAASGFYTLTRNPLGVNSSLFQGVETRVQLTTGELTTRPIAYDSSNPNPEACFPYPIQLYWLNRSGGWQTWVFGQKHEYERETAEPIMYQDELNRNHVAGFPAVLERVNVYSGFIPLTAFDTVFGLVNAVRVYHLDNGIYREIIIAAGAFLKHKEAQRRKELNFSFTYSEPLTVQTA